MPSTTVSGQGKPSALSKLRSKRFGQRKFWTLTRWRRIAQTILARPHPGKLKSASPGPRETLSCRGRLPIVLVQEFSQNGSRAEMERIVKLDLSKLDELVAAGLP